MLEGLNSIPFKLYAVVVDKRDPDRLRSQFQGCLLQVSLCVICGTYHVTKTTEMSDELLGVVRRDQGRALTMRRALLPNRGLGEAGCRRTTG